VLKPTQDYILIKPLERVASKVIKVVLLNELANLGTVIAVGPGKRNVKGCERVPVVLFTARQRERGGSTVFPA